MGLKDLFSSSGRSKNRLDRHMRAVVNQYGQSAERYHAMQELLDIEVREREANRMARMVKQAGFRRNSSAHDGNALVIKDDRAHPNVTDGVTGIVDHNAAEPRALTLIVGGASSLNNDLAGQFIKTFNLRKGF